MFGTEVTQSTLRFGYFTCIAFSCSLVVLVCSFYLTFILVVEMTEGLNEDFLDKILRLAVFRELRGERLGLLGVQVAENIPLSRFGLNKSVLALVCF